MTVAPSLVIVCLPFSSTRSKSPPYGPSVVLIVDWTAMQALMLETTWPRPCDWSVPCRILVLKLKDMFRGLHTFFEDDDCWRLTAERHLCKGSVDCGLDEI
jgi:hypothetical protein